MSASRFGLDPLYAAEIAEIEEAQRNVRMQLQAIVEDVLFERARQARIAAGLEQACSICGCSDTRSCPAPDGQPGTGCVWATENVCSRCYLEMNS